MLLHCPPPLKSYSVGRKDIFALTMDLFIETGQNNRKWFWVTCRLDLVRLGNIAQEMHWDELPKFWKMNLTWYVTFLKYFEMVFCLLTSKFFSSGYECRFRKWVFYLKECRKVCSNREFSLPGMLAKFLMFSVIRNSNL